MLRLCLVTTLLTNLVEWTITDDRGWKIFMRNDTPPAANPAHRRGELLAMSLGRISPKSRMRNVSITVCSRKLSHGAIMPNSSDNAKDVSTTMVTLTRLLVIRMVASSLSGDSKSFLIWFDFGESSRSSACCGVIEKYEISLPLTKPEISNAAAAHISATIWGALNDALAIAVRLKFARALPMRLSVAGKGSISNLL